MRIQLGNLPKGRFNFLREAIEAELFWCGTARLEQLLLGDSRVTFMCMGRGGGKTRAGAEWVRRVTTLTPQTRVIVVNETENELDLVNFNGESGLRNVIPAGLLRGGDWDSAYVGNKRALHLANGSVIIGYGAHKPEVLRGPQAHHAWMDEPAKWSSGLAAWNQLMLAIRLKERRGSAVKTIPQFLLTSTPQPNALTKKVLKDKGTYVVRGETFDNKHLSEEVLVALKAEHAGTRFGLQELQGELLEDSPYALWTQGVIEETRVERSPDEFERIVVSIDPAVSSGSRADECGMLVVGVKGGHYYVVQDATTQGNKPEKWASLAINLYDKWLADEIVAEVNNGGEMVEDIIQLVAHNMGHPSIKVKSVRASRGKVTRAEPVSALYSRGVVHHVGFFTRLEEQMVEFTTDADYKKLGYSPDRVDALVWAMTSLVDGVRIGSPRIRVLSDGISLQSANQLS